jgi:hypothetical protein
MSGSDFRFIFAAERPEFTTEHCNWKDKTNPIKNNFKHFILTVRIKTKGSPTIEFTYRPRTAFSLRRKGTS